MKMYDIIRKKKLGETLTENEIKFFVEGYTKGEIKDYQASAFLMAVYFQGMNDLETSMLTKYMAESGDMIDLSEIPGVKVDKHSTGGVGDKTTLVVGPIVAACGVPVPKMSGRGLGHTGGTLDKLEAIPGFRIDLPAKRFIENVKTMGLSVVGQTGNLTPADKGLYALRDVTSTVDSIPLIAASIMSKKIAAGADAIVLDVKMGSGAFMKTMEESTKLAEAMVAIGEHVDRTTIALITDMNGPLGKGIGNALEVQEAIATLKGEGPEDLTEICLHLSANMLYLAGKGSVEQCMDMAKEVIENGQALAKLREMVKLQDGDVSVIDDPSLFKQAPFLHEVKADTDGWVTEIDTEQCGLASVHLGAGRYTLEDPIDYSAGIVLKVNVASEIKAGETIAVLHTSKAESIEQAEEMLKEAIKVGPESIKANTLIHARVSKDGVERF